MRRRGWRFPLGLWLTAAASTTNAQQSLHFRAESAKHEAAAAEYAQLWREHGTRIVCVLQAETGVVLREREIEVIVFEGSSSSGRGAQPMRLRASYAAAVKQGTLVHELAHRYLAALRLPHQSMRVHQQLDLLLLRVWPQLWGEAFVEPQVRTESQWKPHYRRDWAWALALSPAQRESQWQTLLASGRPRGREPPLTSGCGP